MTKIKSLLKIAEMNGRFTESFLRSKGISRSAVATAIHARLLTRDNHGVLCTVHPANRYKRLHEAVAVDIRPGNPVGVLGDDNKVSDRQVVKDLGNGKVLVIDPSDPNAQAEEVELNQIAVGNERDEEEDRPQSQSQPPSPSTSPSSSISSPSPTI